jgi:hypothetical protein
MPTNHQVQWFTNGQKCLLSVNLNIQKNLSLVLVYTKLSLGLHFITRGISPEKNPGDMQTLCKIGVKLV